MSAVKDDVNVTLLELFRAKIAIDNQQKKSLARKLKVTRPQFSEMLHGDRPIPQEVRKRLIMLLDLQTHVSRLGL